MAYRDDDIADTTDFDGGDLPDPSDIDASEDEGIAETVLCPYCRDPVYEAAERCPSCGSYLSTEDAPCRNPWWLVAGVVLCLAIIVLVWVL
jgi:hypothetical protein